MSEANEVERRRWNDQRWTELWPKRELLTGRVTPVLLRALSLRAGERVLDVGCGGGGTTLRAAANVGPSGSVVGADISAPLTELAADRARLAGMTNVSFQVVDVQTGKIEGAPFTAATSQFGVMFFDEPVTAFGNIRNHLVDDGRLAFACWQDLVSNPWFPVQALAGLMPPTPKPAPGKSATGPFALADARQVERILASAGFKDIRVKRAKATAKAPPDSVMDDAQLVFMGIPAEHMADARAAIAEHMSQFRIAGGRLCAFPLAFQIVTARAA